MSLVIPARNERMKVTADGPGEVLVVVDDPDDTTPGPRLIQPYGPGPANAIRYGIQRATGDVIILMCADGSDDPAVIPALEAAVRGGAAIAVADRYMPGGERIGGPRIRGAMSRLANRALGLDASNLYKAFDAAWLLNQVIESRHGFTIGLELTAKARRDGLPIVRVPVTWRDRTEGKSHWRWAWLPSYIRWWAACARRS